QEWSLEIINEAVREDKPLFVSVGYATCHWCHVMATDTFSDKDTADYLNEHFICIKVDREQRPDIDKYLMNFLNTQSGNGGWPLNVFLTPKVHPIFALTYAPGHSSGSMNSFLTIAKKVYEYYQNSVNEIQPFIGSEEEPPIAEEKSIVENILPYFDHENGGFGSGQKFPPHSTILYLLYFICIENNADANAVCIKTLDAMRLRGLNDHLQGGIFRYCVDPKWTTPHFEKMLYDQAMALWCYSLAYRVLKKDGWTIYIGT
ncbi:thioredoxin domain-containing protein, partial [Candidatus Desantisbacteria bacterium]|nr:thioredoxin domain-containing protein [Candidatus Desantisbacteria bacterium]